MKTMKKALAVMLALVFIMGTASVAAFATDITVNVRIEGINECLFYGDVTVASGATALDAIQKADEMSSKITVTVVDSYYGPYITAVNDDKEKAFGGWDGWSYRVNGIEPDVTVGDYTVKEGSKIVLYYGDPYGEGMQYPVADTSSLASGKLSFKSTDTVYNNDGTATTVENTVKDYILVWGVTNGATVDLYPDANGIVTIDEAYLTEGEHSVQVVKVNDDGLPLVLRLEPDYTLTVSNSTSSNILIRIIEKMKSFIMSIIEAIRDMVKSFHNIGDNK